MGGFPCGMPNQGLRQGLLESATSGRQGEGDEDKPKKRRKRGGWGDEKEDLAALQANLQAQQLLQQVQIGPPAGGMGGGGQGNSLDEAFIKLDIPLNVVGAFIGSGGDGIREIRNACNCMLKIEDDKANGIAYILVGRQGDQDETVKRCKELCAQRIKEIMEKKGKCPGKGAGDGKGPGKAGGDQREFPIPGNVISMFIGKGRKHESA